LHTPLISVPTGSSSPLEADSMVRAASGKWELARTLLNDAIGSYLTACSSLRATCAAALYQSPRSVAVEEILTTVTSEIDSLASEEIKLRGVRAFLSEMRNMSMVLAPINMLPDEILAHVLELSIPHCVRNSSNQIVFHDISAVCKRWRRVTMNATSLWAHIDAGPDTPLGLSTLLLERTRDSPIHIHIYEPEYRNHEHTSPDKVERMLKILGPHMHRVYTLDIDSASFTLDITTHVLKLWLSHSNRGLTGSLLIYNIGFDCPVLDYLVPDGGDNTSLVQWIVPDNPDHILRSLTTIHMASVLFGWNSSAYHGLVDLRVAGNLNSDNAISTSQFAEILSTSPALVVLKLKNLKISQPREWTQPAPMPMNHLSVLNLGRMLPNNGLNMLLPLVGLSQSLPDISVSVVLLHDEKEDEFHAFLARSKITTLYCQYTLPLQPFQPLPQHLIRNLRTLILSTVSITETFSMREILPFSQPPTFRPLNAILLGCVVSFEGLKEFVSSNDIQKLSLDRCVNSTGGSDRFGHWQEVHKKLHETQDQLMRIYPQLECSISEKDSTSQWPCRTMFDRGRDYDGFP
ncbi:hypothetical protein FRC09_014128, partial [Ceratobasidium sp. 395]